MPASRSVAEIDMFITMLRTACENPAVPRPFIAAIACLLDDAVAQKTRETIHAVSAGYGLM
jgi:hypothetical protein